MISGYKVYSSKNHEIETIFFRTKAPEKGNYSFSIFSTMADSVTIENGRVNKKIN